MSESAVVEYVDLCERVAAEALLAEEVEARLYARLDQLWHAEMSEDDRAEAHDLLAAKARAEWSTRPAGGVLGTSA